MSPAPPDPTPTPLSELPFPFRDLLGFTTERGEGEATASIEVEERFFNPNGSVHGAIVFTLIDTSMGAATVSVLDEGERCATIEVHVRYLRAVSSGRIDVATSVVHRGSRVVQLESRACDGDGRLVATATGSFAVIPRPPTG